MKARHAVSADVELRMATWKSALPQDALYTIRELAALSGWTVRYLLELVALPAEHPDHLPSVGSGRVRRVPVAVWQDYSRRLVPDTAKGFVAPASPAYATPVTSAQQGEAGHRGRTPRAWKRRE